MKEKSLSLYIHFPFCLKKCAYCDFVSGNYNEEIQYLYLKKLSQEIVEKSKKYKGEVTTIYFGGGTPTLLNNVSLIEILNLILKHYHISENIEITIEGNPATFDKCRLITLKNGGFNRFSVGVQSFNDKELQALGRVHTAEEARIACENLANIFPNYSLDLMLGIPFQTKKSLKYSVLTAIKLNPKHISAYMLQLEEKTPLANLVASGKINVPDDDVTADFYEYTQTILEFNGYKQYETSNFAMNKFYSHHNLNYWKLNNYLGFGISAHSYYGGLRFFNGDNILDYINNKNLDILEEKLEFKDEMLEFVMLGLRLANGINFKEFKEKFNLNFKEKFSDAIEKNQKYLDIKENNISILKKYFAVANNIIVDFI